MENKSVSVSKLARSAAMKQIEYLAGKYIDPEIALGEVPPLAAIIASVLQDSFRAGVEAAAKAVCPYCKHGDRLEFNEGGKVWTHVWPNEQWQICVSTDARSLTTRS